MADRVTAAIVAAADEHFIVEAKADEFIMTLRRLRLQLRRTDHSFSCVIDTRVVFNINRPPR